MAEKIIAPALKKIIHLSLYIISLQAWSQEVDSLDMDKGYYAVVGSFVIKSNAHNFNAQLQSRGINSKYGYSKTGKIYYVYTNRCSERSACLSDVNNLREDSEFRDAWIKQIEEDSKQRVVSSNQTETKIDSYLSNENNTDTVITRAKTKSDNPEDIQKNKDFFFSLYNATNDRVVEGKVKVVDALKAQLINEVAGNSYLSLPDPGEKSDKLVLICDAFGYRKIQREISYKNPLTDSSSSYVEDMGTSIVVNFDLVKYHKGDIRTLYNVYFFNDASILRPESKFELNQLLQMMRENPNYKIMLHGHTNGSSFGKIIKPGETKDLFNVTKDVKRSVGSAKVLAYERANSIKEYLITEGISSSRMFVKSWGGSKPLYDKNGSNAKKNVRVEVEIIEE